MLNKIIKSIPNTITSCNLLSGVVAIFFAFHLTKQIGPLYGYQWAMIAVFAASIFDFCDGASARLLKAYSDIGKELDSLSDLVSFGVAPSMLLLNTLLFITEGHWVSFVAFIIPVAGALRLAKFNVDTTQSTSFSGLPIPANAIFWIGFVAWVMSHGVCPGTPWLIVIICFMSGMMVSSMRMFSLKFKNFKLKENFSRYVIILSAIVSVALYGVAGLMWTIVLYILISAVAKKYI